MSENMIITIARQYGSGGREIGERAAALLGVECYDKELLTLAAKKSGMNPDLLHSADEHAANSLLYTIAMGGHITGATAYAGFQMEMPINDKLFVAQSDIIRHLAQTESCVVVGRCADYVLRDHKKKLCVFIYSSDMNARIARVAARNAITPEEAKAQIVKTDKKRVSYYNFYTGRKWGKFDNYALSLDTAVFGMEKAAALLADAAKSMDI